MTNSIIRAATFALILSSMLGVAAAAAAPTTLPGDKNRPGDSGVPPAQYPAASPPHPAQATAPPIELALKAAQAIAAGCRIYTLGVAVVNSQGVPILVYIPDGSEAGHTYTAIRKAYTAVTFKMPTSQLVSKAQQDPAFAAKIKADPNLIAFKGGIPLKVGEEIIGAIGVSGAEFDEECGMIGVAAIKDQLK